MVFVGVLKFFEVALKVFVGANFRIKRAHRTHTNQDSLRNGKPKSLSVTLRSRLTVGGNGPCRFGATCHCIISLYQRPTIEIQLK